MSDSTIKRPPSGGVRYSTTAELQERIQAISQCTVKVPEDGRSIIDHK